MTKYVWPDPPSQAAFPIARAGYPLIFAAAFATAVFALLQWPVAAIVGLALTGFIIYFFRDPDRAVPHVDGAVVAPADGKVLSTERVEDCPFYEGPCRRIGIFMSVFNVHVNRMPFDGEVTRVQYHPGRFFSANLDKASRDNERNAVFTTTPQGQPICTVQIAGLVARRIICRIGQGETVVRGQRFGMICFGSRLEVYLPPETDIRIAAGEKTTAGTTILGYLP